MQLRAQIEAAVAHIREITDFEPEIGMVLGSGLGDYADGVQQPIHIPYGDIPGFPVSTVSGHKGRFVLGEHRGKRVIVMQGRFHCYEGYSPQQAGLPIRVMKRLGVKRLLLTNAAGGVNASFPVGTLMLITDHINYSGLNPLTGPNLDGFGPRFPDASDLYCRELRERAAQCAKQAGIPLEEGVYIMFSGPNYETPAEIRMARAMGADAVGMSTVPEALTAGHCGMQALAVSCITNFAAGVTSQPLSHEEVMSTTVRVKSEFVRLLDLILTQVF